MSNNPAPARWLRRRFAWLLFLLPLGSGCLEPTRDHGPQERECTACHGSESRRGGDLLRASPPFDLDGKTSPESRGVGAHEAHLFETESHAAVECEECHIVPDEVFAKGHVDTKLPAEVTFGELARHGDLSPEYDPDDGTCNNTYCHQNSDARWTEPRSTQDACGSCHGLPPDPPHPQREDCERCHGEVSGPAQSIAHPELHVDGKVEVEVECDSCHGSGDKGGPPPDLSGNVATSARGVGAHEAHRASDTHAPVACDECHIVPEDLDSKGHRDDSDGRAEVVFGRLAAEGDWKPEYSRSRLTCTGTYCHQAATPEWTEPRSSADACGSCHELPPPAPHPRGEDCSVCHSTVMASADEFLAPELHVDGVVEVGELKCNSCHGSGENGAPPPDLEGHRDTTWRGVGAHQAHLQAADTHAPVACDECHTVPDDVDDPGHIDETRPADITFGDLARTNNASPSYSFETVSCSNTYCHMSAKPVWTEVLSTEDACGTCHELPPPPPHPPLTDCSRCHGSVIAADRTFVAPELHVNGVVDVGELKCNACHGSGEDGAPPPDLNGGTDESLPGVGAHQRHLRSSATHGPVACGECHTVPDDIDDPGHIDGQRPADVVFGQLATLGPTSPTFDPATTACSSTYCHGSTTPIWTEARTEEAACGTCHELPPPPPHSPLTDCSRCHNSVIAADRTFVAPELHVDGTVEVEMDCGSCHGQSNENPAPPPDLGGSSDRASFGVGAHQAHLSGGASGRPLACGECHTVPSEIDAPGHLDDWGRAEVVLSGPVATARGAVPAYDPVSGTCSQVYCHLPADPAASVTPAWTRVGAPLGCTSCHGIPPPAPHPQNALCYQCHPNIDVGYQIVDRTLHVNGEVDF